MLASDKKANLFSMKVGKKIVITVPKEPLDEIDTVLVVEIEGQVKQPAEEKKAEVKDKV